VPEKVVHRLAEIIRFRMLMVSREPSDHLSRCDDTGLTKTLAMTPCRLAAISKTMRNDVLNLQ
jgi:hypothetical protein